MRLSSLLIIGAIGLCGCNNSSSHSTEAPQEDALNELRDGLKSEDEQARFNAAWAIGNMGPEAQSLVPDLCAVLRNDSSVAVRTMAGTTPVLAPTPKSDILSPSVLHLLLPHHSAHESTSTAQTSSSPAPEPLV